MTSLKTAAKETKCDQKYPSDKTFPACTRLQFLDYRLIINRGKMGDPKSSRNFHEIFPGLMSGS